MEKEEELPDTIDASHLGIRRESKLRKRTLIITLLFIVFATVGVIYVSKLSRPPQSHAPTHPEKKGGSTNQQQAVKQDSDNSEGSPVTGLCGNSSAEARALGCTFDQLTWSWYPPSCPHYANDEFVQAEEWKFYMDKYGRQEASKEDWERAMNNELQLHGERREHITHCVYLMLSVGQVLRDGTPYAKKLVNYEHLDHCAKMMLKSLRKDKYWKSMDTLVPFVDFTVTC